MKKFIILMLFELFLISTAFCSYVDTTAAKTVATNFFVSRISQDKQSRLRSLPVQSIKLELAHQEFDDSVVINKLATNEPYYYVYNVKGNNGFIIVSADDAVTPILGYSFSGKYDNINQPPAFTEWMNNYKQQLKYIKTNKPTTLSRVKSAWSKNSAKSTLVSETALTEVAPLLTTTWNQNCYYNALCPTNANGPCGHVYAGCVATATAQIMKYWSYPAQGKGSHSYSSSYGTLTANFGATTYNWSNMPNSINADNLDIPKLLYHIGVAVNMSYGTEVSLAGSPLTALINYFDYSTNAKFLEKTNYTSTDWENILRNEIDSLRPILYTGYLNDYKQKGHSFVCDGYQNTNYFHFNWGWGGLDDGYFYITDLITSRGDFNYSQGAIIRIYPANGEFTFTKTASNIGLTNVRLNAIVRPQGLVTTVTFEYGTTSSYGNTLVASQSPINGNADVPVDANLSGLSPNTVYHYRVKAVNTNGTFYGSDFSFKTKNEIWADQSSGLTTNLNSVFFVNSSVGYVGGDGGVILKTINGGNTWIALSSGITNDITGVFFLSTETGYAVGYSGKILKTIDGGVNWTIKNSNTTTNLHSVFFVDANNGWVGSESKFLHTTDGGTNWSSYLSSGAYPIYSLFFTSPTTGYAAGNYNVMIYTESSGTYWNPATTTPASICLNGVHFTPDKTGFSCGTSGYIYKKSNSSTTWIGLTSGIPNDLKSIFFTDNNTGYSVGAGGIILKTINSGTNWITSPYGGITGTLNSVFFSDIYNGWTVGENGVILHTKTGGEPCTTLSIIDQPDSTITCIGENVTFSVSVTGIAPTYQWKKDGIDIPDANSTIYTIQNVELSDNGNYTCLIVNPCSNITSNVATLLIRSTHTTPTLTNNGPVCVGSSLSLAATSISDAFYSWTGPNGFASTLQNPTVSNDAIVAMAGTYTLRVTVNGCSSSAETNVIVNPTLSAITITPTSANLCKGDVQSLAASGGTTNIAKMSELFNDATSTFSTGFTSGTPIATQNTTYYAEGGSSYLFNTNSAYADIYFAMTNSIDLSGITSAVLSFSQICATEAGYDYGYVQYSTNNGSSWTTFPTSCYSGSAALKNSLVSFDKSSYTDWGTQFTSINSIPGTAPATSLWKTETINIPVTALSSTQFKIRFRQTADSNTNYYGWLIDNVSIKGNQQAIMNWSPTKGLFTNAAATIAYTGGNAATVYAKPDSSIIYTASAISATGCTSGASVNVVVNTPPSTNATAFTSSAIANNSMTVGWTRGNGNAVLVIARAGSAVNTDPVNGTAYTANAAFGSGTQIGTGNYVVYNGTGTSVNLNSLSAGPTYYYAIYEYNSASNCYLVPALTGNAKTPGTAVTDLDGNVYNTVTIGTQTWMVENLKTTKYNDGTSIPNVTDNTAWRNLSTPAYCWYNNDATTYKNTYGALYNFYAVNTGKLAPTGWHVPTYAEWTTLNSYVNANPGTSGTQAKALAATINWPTSASIGAIGNDLSKNNSSGFSALPVGNRSGSYGTFDPEGGYGEWWSTSMELQSYPWYEVMGYDRNYVGMYYSYSYGNGNFLGTGFSVRCVKQVNEIPIANAGIDQIANEGSTVTLDGSASTDGDNDPLTYKWTAPIGITLSSTTTSKPTFTAPRLAKDTTYTFILVVNDGTVDSPADQVEITVKPNIYTQNIPLIAGWNIISSNVVPSITNLKDIVQPLIDGGKLNKVMDESGKVIEDFGTFGGWQNGIGAYSQTDGYKVNMTGSDALVLQGNAVKLPFNITLSAGWNIASYPCANPQSALAMVQPLIDAGKLNKVMDESGRIIEDFGAYGGWKNNIGDFKAGKGYKIKVSQSSTLTINSSELRSTTKVPAVLSSAYFTKAFIGNGTDHMNIHLVDLAASALLVGDEIGIFDGKVCVGSAAIGEDQLSDGSISIPASCNDALGEIVNGYIPGHSVELKLYREGETFDLTLEKLRGSATFEKDGSLFAKVASKQPTNVSNTDGSILFLCHPNPFAEEIQIDVRNMASLEITVDIYNLFGQKIKMLYKGVNTGLLHLKWNGTNDKGNRIVAGVYLCRVNDQSKKIIFIGGK